VRIAFALDCCDREAMSLLATTGGIAGENVRDLMVAAVEYRFGQVNRLPVTIVWLSDKAAATSPANASVIWRANHSAVGLQATANHNNCRRLWPRTRNAKSC
jgi:transposase InsO family protein